MIIGGYAVLAYGPPRYSDDVDLVIPSRAAASVRAWLKSEGLQRTQRTVPNPQNYEGVAERYESDVITLDLLTDAVRDREAKVDIPERWISSRARRMRLTAVLGRTSIDVPIARPEALWALKLQAGRPRDVSDLFAIAETPFDAAEVEALFRELRTRALIDKLRSVRSTAGTRKTRADCLSRLGLGPPTAPANVRRWDRFLTTIDRIVGPLVEGDKRARSS